ncbi:MAG: hypothetical protein HZB59_10130 [Ignavibacteriales bacterium]|nr:hypothetical protein [Ignavibacteriales bacterium]
MINGAEEIIGGVPGQHLDPMLLAQSQTKESIGFIMISYSLDQDSVQNRKFYDLLFLKGPTIYECARLNQDLRFKLNIDTALQTFKEKREGNNTQVYLYRAPEEIIHRFRSTFYYEPCLKVHIEALTKKQIIGLLKTSRCQQGIIECNEFTRPKPDIHLVEIHSSDELLNFQPTLKHGRLLLYDIEKNKEIIRERYSTSHVVPNVIDVTPNAIRRVENLTPISLTKPVQQIHHPAVQIQMINQASSQECELPSDDQHTIEADEFTKFIQQILNSPMSKDEKNEDKKAIPKDYFISLDKTENKVRPVQSNEATIPKPSLPNKKQARKKIKVPTLNKHNQSSPFISHPSSTGDSSSVTLHPASFQSSEYVHLFEVLFRSFRQQVFECFGSKCEEVISQAEHKVRFLVPEFDCHALKDETVLTLLDLIEEIIKQSSLFKRSKLRQAAVTLVSDLYNKQYELLEKHNGIDAIEQTYYRLRK